MPRWDADDEGVADRPSIRTQLMRADSRREWLKRFGPPTFNHTREDGPFAPCAECLPRMSKMQLIALVRDMRQVREDRIEFGAQIAQAPDHDR